MQQPAAAGRVRASYEPAARGVHMSRTLLYVLRVEYGSGLRSGARATAGGGRSGPRVVAAARLRMRLRVLLEEADALIDVLRVPNVSPFGEAKLRLFQAPPAGPSSQPGSPWNAFSGPTTGLGRATQALPAPRWRGSCPGDDMMDQRYRAASTVASPCRP